MVNNSGTVGAYVFTGMNYLLLYNKRQFQQKQSESLTFLLYLKA